MITFVAYQCLYVRAGKTRICSSKFVGFDNSHYRRSNHGPRRRQRTRSSPESCDNSGGGVFLFCCCILKLDISLQVVIVPCGVSVKMSEAERLAIIESCKKLEEELRESGMRLRGDYRVNYTPGWKFNHWELKVSNWNCCQYFRKEHFFNFSRGFLFASRLDLATLRRMKL